MVDRSSKKKKRPHDINKLAHEITEAVKDESPKESDDPYRGKNPHAVELGRLGGLKGGKARADKLTPEERKRIGVITESCVWRK